MKNKKGFTLIELLAVIVILAILMVIAIPKILDVINGARNSAQNSSKKLLKNGIKTQVKVDNLNSLNNFSKETTTDGECYKFDFDNKNTNYQNLDVDNKDQFIGYTNYCEDGFHDYSLNVKNATSSQKVDIDLLDANIISKTNLDENKHRSDVRTYDGVKYQAMWVWESSTPSDFHYINKINVKSGETYTLSGKAAVWYNCSSHERLALGFSTTNNASNDFAVKTELSGNFSYNDLSMPASNLLSHLQNFEVTINTPGEYYVKGILYQTSYSCSAYSAITELKLEKN